MHAAQCCSKALAPQGDIPTVTRCDGTATALRHAPPPRSMLNTNLVCHLERRESAIYRYESTLRTERMERKAPQQRENSTGLRRGGHPRGSPRKAHPRFILPAGSGLYRRCVSAESPCWPGSAAAACARFPRSAPHSPSGAVSGAPRHLLRYMLHGKLLCLRIVSYRPLSSRLFHLGSVSQQVPSYLPVRVAILQGRLRPRALALAVKIFSSLSFCVARWGRTGALHCPLYLELLAAEEKEMKWGKLISNRIGMLEGRTLSSPFFDRAIYTRPSFLPIVPRRHRLLCWFASVTYSFFLNKV